MRLSILNETINRPLNPIDVAQLRQKLSNRLSLKPKSTPIKEFTYIYNLGSKEIKINTHVMDKKIHPRNVPPYHAETLRLMNRKYKNEEWGVSGAYNPKTENIDIFVLLNPDPEDQEELLDKYINVIAHELEHASVMPKYKGKYIRPEKSYDKYITQPPELDAEIASIINLYRQEISKGNKPTLTQLVQKIQPKYLQKPTIMKRIKKRIAREGYSSMLR